MKIGIRLTRVPKTRCPRGHDLTKPEAVYLKRCCRACQLEAVRTCRDKKKGRAPRG